MHIALLGRQPALSMAELECLYGDKAVRWFSDTTALVNSPSFDFERLGGSQKAGLVVSELFGDWKHVSQTIVEAYSKSWSGHIGKITLGISAYGFPITAREVQKTGVTLKLKLKKSGTSLRLIPNNEPALNTATSHHNKLGLSDNHVELLVIRASSGNVVIAESVGAQNITALAARDQARPKTDAFVGMLPPKLARMMVNMIGSHSNDASQSTILDPFCGTGVVLQEAALLGYPVYGTDLSEKMVDYSQQNLTWLSEKYRIQTIMSVEHGDAMTYRWRDPIHAVVSEAYLGQPFSAPPSPAKLIEVKKTCNYIVSEFLKNLAAQIAPGTRLCLAVPAWRDNQGTFTHLPFIHALNKLGYARMPLVTVRHEQLVYYRETQVVARELLVLVRQ